MLREGFVRNEVTIPAQAANFFNTAHGGFLMVICDTTACMAAYSLGHAVVTMQCSMNFLDSPPVGKTIAIEAQVAGHVGPTVIVDVNIVDAAGLRYLTGRFTLHVDHDVQPGEPFPPKRAAFPPTCDLR